MRMNGPLFFFMFGLTFYKLVTMNFNIILLLSLTIMNLSFYGRSKKYIYFLTNIWKQPHFQSTKSLWRRYPQGLSNYFFKTSTSRILAIGIINLCRIIPKINLKDDHGDDPKDKLSNTMSLGNRFALNFSLIDFISNYRFRWRKPS